jgi:primosomal protein N'
MRTFYTGNDIEDLAASGVKQLEIGSGVALTDMARERAEELGIALVMSGSAPARKAAVQAAVEKAATLPARPKGCQHTPLAALTSRAETTGGGGPVVDQLVEAVSALKKRGGQDANR